MRINFLYSATALVAVVSSAPQGAAPPVNEKENRLVGDGSPRQAYLYEQVTPSIDCRKDSCGISRMELESKGHSFTITGSPGYGPAYWISGGYSVQESKSTSITATCNAGKESKITCVWARIAHTGYKTQSYKWLQRHKDEEEKVGEEFWFWSPNKDKGHDYVCGHDDECWGEGEEWWGKKSKGDALWKEDTNKGGPQAWVWGTDEKDRWN